MKKILTIFLCFLFVSFNSYASLMIYPTRVELSTKNKQKIVRITNSSNKEKRYRISFQHLKANEDGTYEEIKESESGKFIDDFVVFSPRITALKPGKSQVVRLLYRPNSKIDDGEYRSHLLFTEELPPQKPESKKEKEAKRGQITTRIITTMSVSIPVTVSKGQRTGKISITDLKINKKDKMANVSFAREGNSSIYADLSIISTHKVTGKKKEIGVLNSLSVLFPLEKKNSQVRLEKLDDVNLDDYEFEVFLYEKESVGNQYVTNKKNPIASKKF